MTVSRLVPKGMILALSAVALTAAQAAPTPKSKGGVAAWRVECTGDGKTLDCRAVQQMLHRETRRVVVSVVVRPAFKGKGGVMVLQLPLGLNLTEPIAVKVDNGAAQKQAIQTCTNIGCFATIPFGDKLVAAMRRGRTFHVIMRDSNKKTIDVNLPLLGFGLAFDKAK